jgi:RimJ/RimL family protein N-acetyltransferase
VTRPLLVTERLELRPLTAEHTDLLVELDSDPEVMRFLTGRAGTRAEVEARLPSRTDPAQDARGLGYWVVFAGEEFLGWVCLTPWRDEPDAGELGYRLRRTAWGHGYAVEASRALLDHGFGTVRLARVLASTMVVNVRSRAVMERLGMRRYDTLYREWDEPVAGWERGEVVYRMLRPRG